MVQRQGEADQLTAQLRQVKQLGDGDKEALKRATRVQRERAERSEDAAGQLTAQLMQKVRERRGTEGVTQVNLK